MSSLNRLSLICICERSIVNYNSSQVTFSVHHSLTIKLVQKHGNIFEKQFYKMWLYYSGLFKNLKNIKNCSENVDINSSPVSLYCNLAALESSEYSRAMNISSVSTRVQTYLTQYRNWWLPLVSERRYLICCQDSLCYTEILSSVMQFGTPWQLRLEKLINIICGMFIEQH